MKHQVNYQLEVDEGKQTAIANFENLMFQALAAPLSEQSHEGLMLQTRLSAF